MRGPVEGEKGCGEKKTGNGGARRFLKRHGGMEQQGGAGTGEVGDRWRSRGRGQCSQQRPGAAEACIGRVAREQGRRGRYGKEVVVRGSWWL
jgi:hypothetical protein